MVVWLPWVLSQPVAPALLGIVRCFGPRYMRRGSEEGRPRIGLAPVAYSDEQVACRGTGWAIANYSSMQPAIDPENCLL